MTDDNIKNLKVVDFNAAKSEKEKVPESITKSLETLMQKAEEGKIREIVLYAEWDVEDAEIKEVGTGTMSIWNRSQNVKNIMGTIKMLETVALESLMSSLFMGSEEVE